MNQVRGEPLRRWSIAAVLLAAILCFGRDGLGVELDPFPLKPPNTSSPRETLQSFLVNINIAIQRYNKRDDYPTRDAWQSAIGKPFRKAIRCLDLSDIGDTFREVTGVETALFLKEVFDRIQIPPYAEIPGGKAKANSEIPNGAAKEGTTPDHSESVLSWRVPNTEITIARIENGERKGEYLFTKDTVARSKTFYQAAKDLSYKPDAAFGIYDRYIRAPGYWLDPDWIEALPYWAGAVYQDVPVWKWFAMVLSTALGVLVVILFYRWGRRWDEKHQDRGVRWQIGQPAAIIGAIGLALFLRYFHEEQIRVKGIVLESIQVVSSLLITVVVAWAAVLLLSRIARTIIVARSFAEPSMDAHLVRVCTRLVTFVVIAYLVVDTAEVLGIPLAPLLAGLGVGGLAVALAARPTLENFISGIILFVDKPVRVGDFCRYGDKVGTVEEIGLRSTRIRSLDRTLVTVPNADFSQMEIENFARRDQILFRHKMELRRETTEGQLRDILAKVHGLLVADDRICDEPCRIRLTGYGRYSVDLEIFSYVLTDDYSEFLAIREDILLRISSVVEGAGTAYAVPVEIHVPADAVPRAQPTGAADS